MKKLFKFLLLLLLVINLNADELMEIALNDINESTTVNEQIKIDISKSVTDNYEQEDDIGNKPDMDINEYPVTNSVDCITLADENSIICKYVHNRVEVDKYLEFVWIDPLGIISRQRTMLIPAGHGSIYDYRFIDGRASGTWTLKVTEDNKSYKATFVIE